MAQTFAQLVKGISAASAPANSLVIDSSGNVNIDNNAIYVNASNNRVGLGTSSPSNTLHVNSGAVGTSTLLESTGSGSYLGIKNSSGQWTLGATTTNFILENSGGTAFTVDSSRRVGLGTSSPDASLDIVGASAANLLRIGNLSGSTDLRISVTENTGATINSAEGALGRSIQFQSGGFNTVTFSAGGSVGIGTTAGVSYRKLTLKNDGSAGGIAVTNTNDDIVGQFSCENVGTSQELGIYSLSNMRLYTGGTQRATIDTSGRLLVGTSTARSTFYGGTITSNFFQLENTSNAVGATFYANANNNNSAGFLLLGKSRGTSLGSNTAVQSGDIIGAIAFAGSDGTQPVNGAEISAQVDGTPGTNDMPGRLVFSTTADGASSPTERMIIKSGHDVRIGSSPNGMNFGGTLNVNEGGSNSKNVINPWAETASYAGTVIYSYTNTSLSSAFNFYQCNAVNGTAFRVRGDGVVFAQNTTIQSLSDSRLKQNVRTYEQGLSEVLELHPVRFDWKEGVNNESVNNIGFIAQEVKQIIPEAVDVFEDNPDEPDSPYLSMGSSALIPMLVKAVQEQQAMIVELKAKVVALEAQ